MHTKRSYFSADESSVCLVRPGEMVKTASRILPAVQRFIDQLVPGPDYSYVLVNAMGYSEFYGANSNVDWYGYNQYLDFNGLLNAPLGFGDDYERDKMQGSGWPYGFPSYYAAAAYAHHKNTDPQQLGFGDVIFVCANPEMKRIELVIRIFNEELRKKGHLSILSRIEAGERVDVSMGCFKAGAMISLADGTKKPIEDIVVGDRVRTHTGAVGKVTELHRRKYKGEFFEIRPANEDAFTATVEHPFFAAHDAKDAHRVWRREKPAFGWEYAKNLDGAVLSRPKITRTTDSGVSRELARIVGAYLADGRILFSKSGKMCGIELTVSSGGAVNDEIADLCAAVGTKNEPVWRQRSNSDDAVSIAIHDPALAETCAHLADRYSKTKKLDESVLYWPEHLQYEMLGAYFNGDGFDADGDLLCSTSSDDLAHQLREILFRLGIPTSYQYLKHPAGSGLSVVDAFEWVISIGKQWAGKFAPYCSKAKVTEVKRAKNINKDYGDLWAVPIREYVSYYDEADVYNFEVEGDNSYIVNGVAAHNCRVPFDLCSICTDWEGVKQAWKTFDPQLHRHPGVAILAAHKIKPVRGLAITRKDYCECMLKMRGKVLPDGRKVYVYNDFPRFFDISFVLVGADKTARVMWHLGSRDDAPRSIDLTKLKSASMDKEIPGGTAERVDQDADGASDISGLLGSKDFAADPKHNVRLILSSLASLGIVATPHEFQGLVLKSLGASPQSHIFDVRCGGVDDTFGVRPECYSEGVAKIFRPLMEDRSAFAPFLSRRLGHTTGKTASSTRAFQRSSLNDKIAQMYNGYRISVLEKSAELFPKVSSVASIESKGIGPGGLLLGLEPMLHLLSAHLRKNKEEGRSIGIMANLSTSNPNLSSVSTIGAGLRSAMNIDKTSSLTQAASRALEAVRRSTR